LSECFSKLALRSNKVGSSFHPDAFHWALSTESSAECIDCIQGISKVKLNSSTHQAGKDDSPSFESPYLEHYDLCDLYGPQIINSLISEWG
jgi:hypothetical protein